MKKLALAFLIFVQADIALARPYEWEPLETKDYWITGSMTAAAVGAYVLLPRSSREWIEPSRFDEAARNSLRLGSRDQRQIADDWSDVTLALTISIPFGLDTIGIAGLRDDNWSSAGRILNIDIQAFALTGILSATTKAIVGRERPYARACRLDPNADPDCREMDETETYKSFFSGHSAYAFTAAGLACLHHKELQLFGEPGDSAVCAVALTLATTTAALRIAADKHYLSDVTTGALVGIASGVLFPKLMHSVQKGSDATSRSYLVPTATQASIGFSHIFFF